MAYQSEAVANYFLNLGKEDEIPISPMKMQKLVYFAYGWYLAFFDKPLLGNKIQAWEYGPVVADLYHEFKRFGDKPITESATSYSFGQWDKPELPEDKELMSFLDRIWEVYKKFDGIKLSNLTHTEDSPWNITRKNTGNVRFAIISDESIREYFKAQAKQ